MNIRVSNVVIVGCTGAGGEVPVVDLVEADLAASISVPDLKYFASAQWDNATSYFNFVYPVAQANRQKRGIM